MIFSLKKKVSLYDFCYELYAVMFSSEVDFNVVKKEMVLSNEEYKKIEEQAPYLRAIIFQFLISEYCNKKKLNYSDFEIGRICAKSMTVVMLNKFGKSKDEAEDFVQNYLWGFENFCKYFESLKREEKENGLFFHLCLYFSRTIEKQCFTEQQRMRGLTAFDITKQIYRNLEKTLKGVTRHYAIKEYSENEQK